MFAWLSRWWAPPAPTESGDDPAEAARARLHADLWLVAQPAEVQVRLHAPDDIPTLEMLSDLELSVGVAREQAVVPVPEVDAGLTALLAKIDALWPYGAAFWDDREGVHDGGFAEIRRDAAALLARTGWGVPAKLTPYAVIDPDGNELWCR